MIRQLAILICLTSLVGCSTPGPMQTTFGPINTPVFDAIVLDAINSNTPKVKFKSNSFIFYQNGDVSYFSPNVFIVTEDGVYDVWWDSVAYKYNLLAKIPLNNIGEIYYKTYEREYLPDIELLIIKTKNNDELGFSISGSSVAKSILDEM